MQNHTVRFVHTGDDDEGILLTAEPGKTILQLADEHGGIMRAGCRGASGCDLCNCHVIEGVENIIDKKTEQPPVNPEAVWACTAEIRGPLIVVINKKSLLSSARGVNAQSSSE